MVEEQGCNTEEVVALVNESEDVLDKMKSHLRELAVADITKIVLRSDISGNMMINLKDLTFVPLQLEKINIHLL